MIVGISGYGYTGSGAVYDYLKEREDCDCIDEEFNIAYIPHGLQDLEYNLTKKISRYYSSDASIKDFLDLVNKMNSPRSSYKRHMGEDFKYKSIEFIENISQVIWQGWWSYDVLRFGFCRTTWRFRLLGRYIDFWEKINKRKYKLSQKEKMYLSIYPQNFLEEAKKYIDSLIKGFGCDGSKTIIINQPFEANAPENSMRYFNDAMAIVVDRDPRDVYLFAKKVALGAASFIPTDNVNDFIEYYRLCRLNKSQEKTDRILRISFEDMVYDYDNSIHRINEFVGLKDKVTSRRYFNPDNSINNTQLFLKYTEFDADIKMIENELKEYLYPFENFNGMVGDGEPFKCESD